MNQTLRSRLSNGKTLWAAGAYDALTARIIEHAGFEAIFTTGFGISASFLGMPDAELTSLKENVLVVENMCAAVTTPVIADIDTGYGGPINVMRTMREFERAGVQAVVIEDQMLPKRCPLGLPDAIDLISPEAAAKKIEALGDARKNKDIVIIARTDASNLEEATRRGRLYLEAGADIVQPTSRGLKSFDELQRLRDALKSKLSVQVLGWLQEQLTPAQIEEVATIATHALVPLMTATHALFENLEALAKSHDPKKLPQVQMDYREFTKFIGFNEINILQTRYGH
jgi:2-methylisocitrate lyase-like PEP mutase family enzyme